MSIEFYVKGINVVEEYLYGNERSYINKIHNFKTYSDKENLVTSDYILCYIYYYLNISELNKKAEIILKSYYNDKNLDLLQWLKIGNPLLLFYINRLDKYDKAVAVEKAIREIVDQSE